MQKARDALETEPWHLDPRRLPARPSLCLLHFAFGFCLTLPQVWTKRCVTRPGRPTAGSRGPYCGRLFAAGGERPGPAQPR